MTEEETSLLPQDAVESDKDEIEEESEEEESEEESEDEEESSYAGKFSSVEALEQGYKALEKSLGDRSAVPSTYALKKGVAEQIDQESDEYLSFSKAAKDAGLTQSNFDKMLTWRAKFVEEQSKAAAESGKKELAKLGNNPKERIGVVNDWLKSVLTSKELDSIRPALTTAQSIATIEKFMKIVQKETPRPKRTQVDEESLQDEIDSLTQAMMSTKDSAERDRIEAKVEKAADKLAKHLAKK